MKIGLVCPYNMLEHSGGVQEIVINLAVALRARKHEVKIITPRPYGYKARPPKDFILLGNSRRLNGMLSTSGDVAVEVDGDQIDEVLSREKFDCLNFHEPWVPVLARQIILRSRNEALIGTFHANLADSPAAKTVVNLLAPYGRGIGQKLHLITATSLASAAVLLNKGFKSPDSRRLVDNLKMIPCAVDLKFYHPFKKRVPLFGEGTQTVVYVGRPDKRKGADWLIRAFAELSKDMPSVHLVIIGDGSRLSRLRQLAKLLKVANVKFVGRVNDEEKRRLLGNADLACFPALYGEGFGIVLVEAMAMNTPLLAGNNLGYQTVMKGTGRLGLIDPKATTDFANRMALMLTDKNVRQLMSDWSKREVKQYDYAKIAEQYESAYKEALEIFRGGIKLEEGKVEKQQRKAFGWLAVRR